MRRPSVFLLLLALTGSPASRVEAAAGATPFTSGSAAVPANEDERRVWSQAAELNEAIARAGVVYDDPELTAYVQGVMDRVFPEFKGRIQVTLLKSPLLNAFALPDGHIYVNVGLAARFQNEAQLATVLAHEGTHFTNRHSYLSEQGVKSKTALATFGMIAFGGIVPGSGMLAQLLTVSSILGYSRELETEADTVGYARLQQAGYDVKEAPRVFEHLIRDVKAEDIKEPFFFSTHPKLQERVDNMTRLSANAVGGGRGDSREAYSAVMSRARFDTLEAMLSMGRAKQVLVLLDDPHTMQVLGPKAHYYEGEAYRLRAENGDAEKAQASYRAAIERVPDYAPPYRALGVAQLKSGRYAEAQAQLERYLQLAPDAKDRKYVESYLRTARQKAAQDAASGGTK